jgi:hypothetical protein
MDGVLGTYSELIGTMRGGVQDAELSDDLQTLVQRVQDLGKPGKLTVTLTVKPAGNGRVEITAQAKAAQPCLECRKRADP